MSHQLKGWTAIEYAERHGGTLQKYTDPIERALKRVSIEKAKRVAGEDPSLIHMTVKSGNTRKRKNPTKAQKREKAKKKAAQRRIAVALKNFVRKANPAAKGVVKATKVKGGWNVRVVDVRRSK